MFEINEHVQQVVALVDEIKPILAGKNAQVQGAVLADLLSIWLAGHVGGSDKDTRKLQDELMTLHIETVRALVHINDRTNQ